MTFRDLPIFAESWNVAYRRKQTGTILEETDTPFSVIPNAFRYWAADPFVIEWDGKVYIFAELYDYILRRGILGYCDITEKKPGKWIPVIRENYHLSYPCLVKRDGCIYLMPESGADEVLTVYEATDFPKRWKKRKVLLSSAKLADTTPIPVNGRKLVLTHCVNHPEKPQLMLIDLDEDGTAIAVSDAIPFRSRPAGHVFEKNGKLIRPAQLSENCDRGYGKGLIFYECCTEGALQYTEKEIAELHPEDLQYDRKIYLDGMHTYNSNERFEVIDIKTRRFNILNFVMRIAGKVLR